MGPGSVFEGHTYGLQGKIVPPDELPVAREALVTLLTRREEVRARIETVCCLPDESAARYLDSKMREIRSSGKVIGADRVAVMAALNITHDLLHKQERMDNEHSSTRERVRELLERVDRALTTDQPGRED